MAAAASWTPGRELPTIQQTLAPSVFALDLFLSGEVINDKSDLEWKEAWGNMNSNSNSNQQLKHTDRRHTPGYMPDDAALAAPPPAHEHQACDVAPDQDACVHGYAYALEHAPAKHAHASVQSDDAGGSISVAERTHSIGRCNSKGVGVVSRANTGACSAAVSLDREVSRGSFAATLAHAEKLRQRGAELHTEDAIEEELTEQLQAIHEPAVAAAVAVGIVNPEEHEKRKAQQRLRRSSVPRGSMHASDDFHVTTTPPPQPTVPVPPSVITAVNNANNTNATFDSSNNNSTTLSRSQSRARAAMAAVRGASQVRKVVAAAKAIASRKQAASRNAVHAPLQPKLKPGGEMTNDTEPPIDHHSLTDVPHDAGKQQQHLTVLLIAIAPQPQQQKTTRLRARGKSSSLIRRGVDHLQRHHNGGDQCLCEWTGALSRGCCILGMVLCCPQLDQLIQLNARYLWRQLLQLHTSIRSQ